MKVSKKLESARDAALRKAVRRKTPSDSTEKTAFHIAVKNIEEILKKKEVKASKTKKAAQKKVKEPVTTVEDEKKQKKQTTRGVMYLGHIPHGFYEDQMLDYFKQFGKVRRVRVARSRKTGQSRGYAFVEFEHSEVAKVAAETMHNYLMCGRLLKATYIPPEKQHGRYFSGKEWTKESYPKSKNRLKTTKLTNAQITDEKHRRYVSKTLNRLSTLQKSLEAHGITIKFTPTTKSELQEK